MLADLYTKIVLTLIATALVGLMVQNAVTPSIAQIGVQKVTVCSVDGNNCATVTDYGTILTQLGR